MSSPHPAPHEQYLLARVELLRRRCRDAVVVRQSGDPEPDDQFRGLYVTDDQVWPLLQPPGPLVPSASDAVEECARALEQWADDLEASEGPLRLRCLARRFGLTDLDVDVLVVALAPDLDPRLEKVFGYLHDDVTRRRASVGLALELANVAPASVEGRARLGPAGPLVDARLLLVEEPDRPFLTRSLRVPDSVVAFLLGDDGVEAELRRTELVTVPSPYPSATVLVRALGGDAPLVYVRDKVGAAALSFVAGAIERTGRRPLAIDLDRLEASDDVVAFARLAARRALFDDRVLVAGPLDALGERDAPAVRAFAELDAPTVLIGTRSWDPSWSVRIPVVLDAPELPTDADADLPYRLTPEQADRARRAAALHAAAEGEEVGRRHLAAGARAQNAGGLERLALRVSPDADWDDLVLPPPVLEQLRELVGRVRFRDQVLSDWGLRRGSARGRGVTALFAGDSGTGKTLSAEVVAGALGLDLYVVDLATVVDKYIGETEKNLDRIFREADRVNGVLLFDEADAIFGKRSEVQDARDRYANVEVAYLLQRMERFDGIAILTTNLRANLDDAFLRRLDCLVDFPLPDEDMRLLLWEAHLPPSLPREAGVDLPFLARSFDLPGGNIRNIALAAAFLAASEGTPLTMSAMIRATAREYRKLGRLTVAHEFGPYFDLVHSRGGEHGRV